MKFNKPQIFILHFAGGSMYSFDIIKKYIPNSFEVHPLELPGRGMRMSDSLIHSHLDATHDYLSQIKANRTSAPFIIYAHSMGALLALLITEKLESSGDAPESLVLTGNVGLRLKGHKTKPIRYLMNDENFKKELIKLGGVPDEVLNNQDLFEFFSPIIRADFQVAEELRNTINVLVKTPIQILNGSDEEFDEIDDDWSDFTENSCTHRVLSGGHFFIFGHPQEIADSILKPLIKIVT